MADKKQEPDVEQGEVHNQRGKGFDADDKKKIQQMENIGGGGGGSASFRLALQMAARTAFFTCVVASVVWVPFIRKPFPDTLQGYMGLAALLYLFTVNGVLGQTISNSIVGIWGTWLACTHMWVMQGIFPGGMEPGMSNFGIVSLFGWANLIGFTWLLLWCKSSLGLKMFALSYDVGFMLDFLNPNSAATYSTHFKIKSSGIAVNCMLATIIACVLAVLTNLIPYPLTTAYSSMKSGATKAAKDTAQLVEVLIDYYSGEGPSIVIESAKKHAAQMRTHMDGMGGSISAAYFEGLDLGVRGTIRKCNENHLAMLNVVFDRIKAILIALQSEDFSESHQTIMREITPACRDLGLAVEACLMDVTEAIGDGDIDAGEKDNLRARVEAAKDAVAKLSQSFDTVRRTFDSSVHPELLGESFFVLTLSAYARLVWEFTEEVLDKPLPAGNLMGDFTNCIKSTWSLSVLTEKYNMNFAVRYTVAVLLGVLYSIEIAGWVGTTAVFCTLLISTRVSPDVQASLNVLLAVVASTLTGAILFDHVCMTGFGDYLLPLAAFLFWSLCLYAYWSKSKFMGIGLLAAAVSAPRLVALCPTEGNTSAGAAGMWNMMISVLFAIAIIAFAEMAFSVDRASNLALNSLHDAFKGLQAAFDAFWTGNDISAAIAPVAGHCSDADTFNGSADIEPRLWRIDWKVELHKDLVESVRKLRLDLLMMDSALQGSTGSAASLFEKLSGSAQWATIRHDLDSTLEQARHLAIGLQGLEIGSFDELQSQVDFESENKMDELEDLPAMVQALAALMKFPSAAPPSMEDDDICKVSVVLVMLQATCSHIAHIINVLINNA